MHMARRAFGVMYLPAGVAARPRKRKHTSKTPTELAAKSPHKKAFLPFKQALDYARDLGLKTSRDWKAWSSSGERPDDVPAYPERAYKDGGWKGYAHWLGTGNYSMGEVEFIVNDRTINGAKVSKEYQIHWKGYGKEARSVSGVRHLACFSACLANTSTRVSCTYLERALLVARVICSGSLPKALPVVSKGLGSRNMRSSRKTRTLYVHPL